MNQKKEKILIFNGYYHPAKNYGGPITSIENVVNACHDEFDFYIVSYNHDFKNDTPFDVEINQWVIVENANVMYVPQGYLDFSKQKMNNLLTSLKPNLIWFSGVLTPNYKIVTTISARKLGIPVLLSPRGEVSADRVKLKAYKKVPYLRVIHMWGFYKDCYFHATRDDEKEGLKKYFSPEEKHLFKVPNISIFQQGLKLGYKKEKDILKVFFFSRIHEVKNLFFAIQCICECKKTIVFDIYGPIESEDYWNECLLKINSAPKNISIQYCGLLNYMDKSRTIQKYDCFLFPTINENYGHVIAESLANSRPVILSKGTTPWDDLDGRAGYVIPLGKPELFIEKLDYLASLDSEEYDDFIVETGKYFKEKTAVDNAVLGHKKMFVEIMNVSEINIPTVVL